MVAKKTVKNDAIDIDDEKMDIKLNLKKDIEYNQRLLVKHIAQSGAYNRAVDAVCTDIETCKRILSALEDVKV